MGHRHPKDEPCAVARHAQHVQGHGGSERGSSLAGRQGRRITLTRKKRSTQEKRKKHPQHDPRGSRTLPTESGSQPGGSPHSPCSVASSSSLATL
eukprot:scaffold142959_cov160-Phaeocystis_antarctica.AAC.1